MSSSLGYRKPNLGMTRPTAPALPDVEISTTTTQEDSAPDEGGIPWPKGPLLTVPRLFLAVLPFVLLPVDTTASAYLLALPSILHLMSNCPGCMFMMSISIYTASNILLLLQLNDGSTTFYALCGVVGAHLLPFYVLGGWYKVSSLLAVVGACVNAGAWLALGTSTVDVVYAFLPVVASMYLLTTIYLHFSVKFPPIFPVAYVIALATGTTYGWYTFDL